MPNAISTKICNFIPFTVGATIPTLAQHKGLISPPYLTGMWTDIWNITSQIPVLSYLPIPTHTPIAAAIYPIISGLTLAVLLRGTSAKKANHTCSLGNLTWDRNAFCRGWLITGGTGCGKTAVAIALLIHQVFQNEGGKVRESWKGSKAERSLKKLRKHLDKDNQELADQVSEQEDKLTELKSEFKNALDREFATGIDLQLDNIEDLESENPRATIIKKKIADLKDKIRITKLAIKRDSIATEIKRLNSTKTSTEQEQKILTLNSQVDQLLDQLDESSIAPAEAEEIPEMEDQLAELRKQLRQAALPVEAARIQGRIEEVSDTISRNICQQVANIQSYASQYDSVRDLIFEEYPWGGICVDEKGLYYQTFTKIAQFYDRDQDLCLLQTRPTWAPDDWTPPSTYNLLSDYEIPANTYANAIVETANSVADGEGDKGFFQTQAKSNIGWAIELYRSIRRGQQSNQVPEEECVYPTLKNILEILTDEDAFSRLVTTTGAQPPADAQRIPPMVDDDGNPISKPIYYGENNEPISVIEDKKLDECLSHFKNRYWSQPKEQLGGVQGTIYNYLNYFAADDIAEVFCTKNTFDLADISKGKIVCIAMPQKLQIERRYVGTILKILFYEQVLRRFDIKDADEFSRNNLLIAWQDEAQRFIIEQDGNVDVTREASGTTVVATQQQPALWTALGNKDQAKVTIGNLRNRFIFRASTSDCAEASADFLGKETKEKITRSVSKEVSKSYSEEDSHKIKPHHLQKLKDFTAYIVHADGHVRKYLIKPKTAECRDVSWWSSALLQRKMFLPWLLAKLRIHPDFLKRRHR